MITANLLVSFVVLHFEFDHQIVWSVRTVSDAIPIQPKMNGLFNGEYQDPNGC